MDFGKINAFLIDLDGVLYVGRQLIDGAAEALRHLRRAGKPLRFLTNTTTRSRKTLHQKVTAMGLEIEEREIISAPQAAVRYLRENKMRRCFLILSEDACEDFTEFERADRKPECVVIGDIGEDWNYDILNRAFRCIKDGAAFIALHRGKWWRVEDGLQLDIGVFVAGLEYATDSSAIIMGKPAPDFFQMAVSEFGVGKDEVAMIGDDIRSDVGGAQEFGLRGVLVRTGKFEPGTLEKSDIVPDAILDSIHDLVDLV